MGLGIRIPKSALAAGREKFAKGDENDNIELEPGKYLFQVVKGRAVKVKGEDQVVFDLQLKGEDKVGKASVFFALTEDRIIYLFRLFATLGYDVTNLDEAMLDEIVADIESTKPVVRVKVTKSGDYTNYRVEKLVTDVAFTEDAGHTESAVDENAGSVTAGRQPEQVVPAKAEKPAPAPAKPAPKAEKPAPAPVAPPAEEEAVADDEAPVQEEEEAVELKVGMSLKANLKSGVHDVTIEQIHEAEQKVTARSKTDNKLYKFGLDKLM